eukprot:TRINITY_DN2113_c0_g2_i2.p1 TRINITY_DN2113_c0_g2~~TRINITY_DN2113_c0_g2_i2.p1  ORF type:complete len:445 (-),score=89.62 TRINITY_DN2113_c0_g2_i2:480-1814(-)
MLPTLEVLKLRNFTLNHFVCCSSLHFFTCTGEFPNLKFLDIFMQVAAYDSPQVETKKKRNFQSSLEILKFNSVSWEVIFHLFGPNSTGWKRFPNLRKLSLNEPLDRRLNPMNSNLCHLILDACPNLEKLDLIFKDFVPKNIYQIFPCSVAPSNLTKIYFRFLSEAAEVDDDFVPSLLQAVPNLSSLSLSNLKNTSIVDIVQIFKSQRNKWEKLDFSFQAWKSKGQPCCNGDVLLLMKEIEINKIVITMHENLRKISFSGLDWLTFPLFSKLVNFGTCPNLESLAIDGIPMSSTSECLGYVLNEFPKLKILKFGCQDSALTKYPLCGHKICELFMYLQAKPTKELFEWLFLSFPRVQLLGLEVTFWETFPKLFWTILKKLGKCVTELNLYSTLFSKKEFLEMSGDLKSSLVILSSQPWVKTLQDNHQLLYQSSYGNQWYHRSDRR